LRNQQPGGLAVAGAGADQEVQHRLKVGVHPAAQLQVRLLVLQEVHLAAVLPGQADSPRGVDLDRHRSLLDGEVEALGQDGLHVLDELDAQHAPGDGLADVVAPLLGQHLGHPVIDVHRAGDRVGLPQRP
jgi:hypothetical protein